MNKIIPTGNRFPKRWNVLKLVTSFGRNYTKDTKDTDKEKPTDADEVLKARKGILHDKQQSLQEESYFHREETEQLKELKKKLAKKEKEEKKD